MHVLQNEPGFCDETTAHEGIECSAIDHKGVWAAAELPMCIKWCHQCVNCRFVSFSAEFGDCSWFHSCKKLRAGQDLKGYIPSHRTWQVRFANGSSTPAALETLLLARGRQPSKPLTRRQVMETSKWVRQLQNPRRHLVIQVGANSHSDTSYINDDPGPLCVSLGWRAVLIEPLPPIFSKLQAKYPNASVFEDASSVGKRRAGRGSEARHHRQHVSLHRAAVCDTECRQPSITLCSSPPRAERVASLCASHSILSGMCTFDPCCRRQHRPHQRQQLGERRGRRTLHRSGGQSKRRVADGGREY